MINRHSISLLAATLFLLLAAPQAAFSQSGLITKATKLEPITLSSGKPLAAKPYEIEAGKYYRLTIKADGTAELAISGPEFFRNVWINEVVINDIEVRPLGLDSIEFDAAGEVMISFIPIRPGEFTLRVPGTNSAAQTAVFKVK
jgi:hypothetical protein